MRKFLLHGAWQASRSGLVARGCKRCAALGMHDLPVNDEAHLFYSFRVQLPLWLGGGVDLHNCQYVTTGPHVVVVVEKFGTYTNRVSYVLS
jgi:hypothetical protein